TIPHDDRLVPELEEAWKECRETFGEGNVLIVSNSAGTYLDAGGLQSESVSYHLSVPVLQHKSFKPAYSCISAIRKYFTTLQEPIKDNELIIVGDRIFTDVVLANRMRRQDYLSRTHKRVALEAAEEQDGTLAQVAALEKGPRENTGAAATAAHVREGGARGVPSQGLIHEHEQRHPAGPLSVWTTGVWKKESMIMRRMERGLVDAVEKWSTPPAGEPIWTSQFIKKPMPNPEEPVKQTRLQTMLSRLKWPGK
ncbi:hypothetical protein CVT24_006954, partial [Panaeolus cyanescens]